ncbi:MAG: hypothetical protein CL610_16435 [Anaerolineaceae bacterium]|nr:hypothetical protein [Anaerolineaceae bacterium]
MTKPLNALIIEDSQSDALLLLRELRRGGFDVHHLRVDNAQDMKSALANHKWDVILSDYSMPAFDALAALKVAQEQSPDIPFIIISGTVGEDAAVAAMKAGASDFFAKGKLTRLVPAVERELREAAGRRQRGEAEARFTTAFHSSPVGTVISRLSDGQVLDVNARFLETFNLTRDAVIGKTARELDFWVVPEYQQEIAGLLREGKSARGVEVEYEYGAGRHGYALFSVEIIELNDEACTLTMVQDVTESKKAEAALRASEEKFRLLAENATDMISRLMPDCTYLYVSPSSRLLLGYEPEEMVMRSSYDFYHPDDLEDINKSQQIILARAESSTVSHRIQHKDGHYIWFETTSRTIRHPETNEVIEIQSASRDISERKRAEQSLKRYAERLELLHDVDRAILTASQPATIAQVVLAQLKSLLGFDSASVTVFDADYREFTIIASIDAIADYRPYENRAVIEMMQQDEIFAVDDLARATHISPGDDVLIAAGIRSYVRIPLVASGKLLGSFNLRARRPSVFSTQSIDIAREVAAQLAIAIENARLLEVEHSRNSELTALHQASLQLTSSLDVETVLYTILDYAILLVHANNAHVFLYDGQTIRFGAAQWDGEKQPQPFAEPRQDGLTYRVARSGQRMVIPNVNHEPIYANWQWGGAIIGLPLRVANEVNGVMSLAFAEPHSFDEHEIRLLELLADQAAIAIHNAQLYQQIQRHAGELEQRVSERTAELQASESKYRALIEFAPDPIVIIDETGVITLVNRQTEISFGYEQQELIGRSIDALLPGRPGDLSLIEDMGDSDPDFRTLAANLEVAARHKNGMEIPVKIGMSPIHTGAENLIMTYIVDITAEKQLEASLRAALAHEKELNELKSSFTSIVSHEFRTPLSVILSSTDLLTKYFDRMDQTRRLEKFDNITRQVSRLVKLLDDVLTITRSERVGFEFKPTSLDLVALCEEIIEEVKVGYTKDVTVLFSHQGACQQVSVDEFLFRHILQNLASNAIKYSRDEGIIRIDLNCADTDLTLRVEDRGIGIPEQYKARLFETFHRAANVGQIQGTGIGLTIVKHAVDAHGGSIEVESTEGVGTTFTIFLPITAAGTEVEEQTDF